MSKKPVPLPSSGGSYVRKGSKLEKTTPAPAPAELAPEKPAEKPASKED